VFDPPDGALVPSALVADTKHAYVLPFVKPFTTIGLAVPNAKPLAPPFDDVHNTV